MRKPGGPVPKRLKVQALVIMGFLLCNLVIVTPVFANTANQAAPASLWCDLFPWLCPSPTPGSGTPAATATPTATHTVTATVTATGTVTVTATAGATGTPGASPTPTPQPKGPLLTDSNSFTFQAASVIGINARLDLSDLLAPTLIFQSSTIQGLKISKFSFSIAASGTVTTGLTKIKTSVFQQIVTALSSFVNKADLITLTLGGTVPRLVMTNVTLQVDHFLDVQSISLPGLHIVGS